MIKRFALLTVIFVLSLAAPASAVEPGQGVIEGQIINGSEKGNTVANQEITLKTYLNDAEVELSTSFTDTEGRFVFEHLSTDAGYSYQATINFQEAEYNSEWLFFDDGETTKFTMITIYDATDSDEAIRVELAHTIIYVESDSLRVEEYLLFANDADQTYIGLKNSAERGTRETLRFSLPEEAIELQPVFGLMECCVISNKDGFVDTMPVLPGQKEVLYSYRISHNAEAYEFFKKINYPVANFTLLVQGEGAKIWNDQLVTREPLDVEGVQFNHFSGTNLTPGEVILTQLSGLSGSSNLGSIAWLILVLAVLTGGFSFVYTLRKRKNKSAVPESSLEQLKQQALTELAQLDDDFEDGKLDEEVYHRLRAEKKTQLIALMKMAEE